MPKQKSSSSTKGGGYYAVRSGRVPGIYRSWGECEAQVTGYPRAQFKKFSTEQEARSYVGQSIPTPASPSTPRAPSLPARPTPYSRYERVVVELPQLQPQPQIQPRIQPPIQTPSQTQSPPQTPTQKQSQTHPGIEPPTAGTQPDGRIVIYTDGASTRNGMENARAGVGVYFGPDDPRNVSEPLAGLRQTNQRAELTAIIRAIEQVMFDERRQSKDKDERQKQAASLTIVTDSMYSINCLTNWLIKWERNGWVSSQGKPVDNADLIKTALRLIRQRDGKVGFFHVPGHAGIEGNECADRLAVAGCNIGVPVPVPSQPPHPRHGPLDPRFDLDPASFWWSYFF